MSKYTKLTDELRTELESVGIHPTLVEKLQKKLAAITVEHTDRCQVLQAKIDEVKGELQGAQSDKHHLQQEVRRANVERLWDHPDGRRIIEAAFAHDPMQTRTALNYLGSSLIAGELSDQALSRSEAQVALFCQ